MNTELIKTKSKYYYSAAVKKLILTQFGSTIMAIMISMPTATSPEDGVLSTGANILSITTTVLALMFFFYIQYTAMWDIAAKDKLAIDGNRMIKDENIGLKASLLANIPTYAFAMLCIIFRAIFLLTEANAIGLCSDITYAIELIWNYMYHGFLVLIVPSMDSYLSLLYFASFALFTIPSLICCLIAYRMGLKGKRIFPEKKKD